MNTEVLRFPFYLIIDNIKDVKSEVDRVIVEYNHYRYPWGLNKMTPVQYRDHLIAA
ncbi:MULTISPECIES: IS3 family transposase [Niallia]|uniref:IS3 family transposase n=1 Tax=Niallia TaxID=2837506 RepID=UPI0011408F27|nr:IS3 family transposase [Niallia circulans]NRG29791.1 IS3 family transposase [Niallia circulans]QJX64809.1 IS3 family transposase [Niallia circulans]